MVNAKIETYQGIVDSFKQQQNELIKQKKSLTNALNAEKEKQASAQSKISKIEERQ